MSERTTDTYFASTRTATFGFLAALPLLVAYESLVLLLNKGAVEQVRVGADVWVKTLLSTVGSAGMFGLGIGVLLIGVVILYRDRHRNVSLQPRFFLWGLGESLLYAIVLAFAISATVGALFNGFSVPSPLDKGTMLVLSLGAGLYEELIFRVVLVGGLYAVARRFLPGRIAAYFLAAVVGALLFSWVHYVGPYGDPFTFASFTFRFLFGLALNGLYLVRGFGIAAWTHALYDVLVVTQILG